MVNKLRKFKAMAAKAKKTKDDQDIKTALTFGKENGISTKLMNLLRIYWSRYKSNRATKRLAKFRRSVKR